MSKSLSVGLKNPLGSKLSKLLSPLVLALSTLVVTAGCGSGNMQQTTYPTSGIVKLDGKPVKGALVVFHPVDKTNFKWQEVPQGTTDDQGKFSLFTYASNDGAPAGEYMVGIALMGETDDEGGDQVKQEKAAMKIPAQYADSKTSGLKATLEKKENSLAPFELSSR